MNGALLAMSLALSDPPSAPEGYATETIPLQGPEDPDIPVIDTGETHHGEWMANTGPRLRFGVGGWAALGSVGSTAAGALGLSLRAGFVTHGGVGCYVQGQATTLLLAGWYSLGALGEIAVSEHVALAAGMGVAGGYGFLDRSSFFPHSVFAVGVPVRAQLSIGGSERHRLALSLDGWLGEDPNHTKNGLYGYAGVGLSFEMM